MSTHVAASADPSPLRAGSAAESERGVRPRGEPPDAARLRPARSFPYPLCGLGEPRQRRRTRPDDAADMARARALAATEARNSGAVYILPGTAWARRVSGVFANELAQGHPAAAHAILTRSPQGHITPSACGRRSPPAAAPTSCAAASRPGLAGSRQRRSIYCRRCGWRSSWRLSLPPTRVEPGVECGNVDMKHGGQPAAVRCQ